MKRVITEARITAYPKELFDPLPKVMVKFSGAEEEEFLFDFYPDEIDFKAEEFIGLTRGEAFSLRSKKDLEYLRTGVTY